MVVPTCEPMARSRRPGIIAGINLTPRYRDGGEPFYYCLVSRQETMLDECR